MAGINYVEFHNFEVDCSEISGDESEILEIMRNSDVSIQNLCEAEFSSGLNIEERDELIEFFTNLSGEELNDFNSESITKWIAHCEDFEILLDLLSAVTVNLYRVIRSRGQL